MQFVSSFNGISTILSIVLPACDQSFGLITSAFPLVVYFYELQKPRFMAIARGFTLEVSNLHASVLSKSKASKVSTRRRSSSLW